MIADEASMAHMMAAAQRGDREMYRVLLGEVQLWLARYFRKRVPPAQLDDLVQEVMMAVHAKRATWAPTSAEDELGDHDAAEDSEEEAVMARMSLERLFVHLPDRQVEVIELVKIEGLSIAEAAERTGQSESLVKVNIHRGLKKLSALVEKAE